MKKIISSLALLFIVVHVHAEPELKGSPSELAKYLAPAPPETTSLTGEATTKAPADHAIVTLKVTTDNKALQAALRANEDVRTKVVIYLKQQGLTNDSVKASKFSSTPEFGWTGDKAKSYHIENTMRIAVRDEKELLAIAGAVDSFPEVQYVSTDFEYDKKDDLKSAAITKACDHVLERKKAYEEKFGVKLTVKNFHENEVGEPLRVMMANYENNNSGRIRAGLSMSDKSAAEPAINPAFGEFTCSARVIVEYTVERK